MFKKINFVLKKNFDIENTILKSKDLNKKNIVNKPKLKLKSPILLTIIAFRAALLACILVYQKLINKYEQIPTPSQPKNNNNKLSEVIKKAIKKVNSDKVPINLIKCGSFDIYSKEYICTKNETKYTINNIEIDILSKIKPHRMKNKSKFNQTPKFI